MAWYDNDWSNRFKVTIDNTKVSADLTDYTVYLELADIGAGHGFWGNVNSDGSDIRITKSDETTEVPREIVNIDTTGKTGEVYFKASGTLSSTADTDFWVYYGNAGASEPAADSTYGSENVWTDYLAVWHLDSVNDSTASGLNGTLTNSATIDTSDRAFGSGDSLNVTAGASDSRMTFTSQNLTDFTIHSWIKRGSTGSSHIGVFGDTDYMWWRYYSSTAWRIVWNNSGDKYSGVYWSAVQGQWINYVWTRSGSTNTMYVDGSQEDSTWSEGSSIDLSSIGSTAFVSINGNFDEVRIATSSFSSDWVSTNNNNQSDSSNFYTIGAEESGGGGGAADDAVFYGCNF